MTKGEQLTEKFFVEVKGWKNMSPNTVVDSYYCDGEHVGYGLPELHTSLDLQEEWLWPELRENMVELVEFNLTKEGWWCSFLKVDYVPEKKRKRDNGLGETKALAQLTAGLKALGVACE